MISSVPFVLAVAPHVPARTLAELAAYAKANPNKLNFGAPTGTLPHLTGEVLKTRAGIDIVHIPYKGAATAITDVLSGQMDMAFEPISVMVGHVREGKVIPLAVTGPTRSPELPSVPTMIESGYPGFVSMSWTGIVRRPARRRRSSRRLTVPLSTASAPGRQPKASLASAPSRISVRRKASAIRSPPRSPNGRRSCAPRASGSTDDEERKHCRSSS